MPVRVASIALLVLALAACASPRSVRGDFVVTELNGRPVPVDTTITVKIEAGWLYGHGPVNRWQTRLEGASLGTIVTSRMAGPPSLMELESDLMAALDGAVLGVGPGDDVEIRNVGGVVARLEPAPAGG